MLWALRRDNRNYPPTADDIEKGKKWLEKLIDRFDALRVVVLCGNKAQKATGFLYVKHSELCVLHAPHPSPQAMNQDGKEQHLRAAIRKAASKISDRGGAKLLRGSGTSESRSPRLLDLSDALDT